MDKSATLTRPVSADDHAEGPADAPLTLVEYGDYQCPYCGAAYPVVKRLQKTLGKKLRFVFRNFPLTQIHPYALIAAEAAEAAALQGKFWEMHDLLFEQQTLLKPEIIPCGPAFAAMSGGHFTPDLDPRVAVVLFSHVLFGVGLSATFGVRAPVSLKPADRHRPLFRAGPADKYSIVSVEIRHSPYFSVQMQVVA